MGMASYRDRRYWAAGHFPDYRTRPSGWRCAMINLAKDFRNAPAMAMVFILAAVMTAWFIAERLGVFDPGPPLSIERIVTTVVEDKVYYTVEGTKLTDRNLIAQTASWLFSDDSVMPVAIERVVDGFPASGQPRRVQGDHFISAMNSVAIPEAASTDMGVRLRWCWAYESTPTFCVDRLLAEIVGG